MSATMNLTDAMSANEDMVCSVNQSQAHSIGVANLTDSILQAERFYLRNVAGRMMHSFKNADLDPSDIVMDALHIGLRRREQFDGKSLYELRKWLVGILKNLCRRYIRDLTRRKHVRQCDMHPVYCKETEPVFKRLRDLADPHPDEIVMKKEARVIVYRAIGKLPPKLADVMILKVTEDISIVEIADRLRINAFTAQKRYERAIERMLHMPDVQKLSSPDS